MVYSDREEKIINVLKDKNLIRSSELAKLLYVSISTLRRDLERLEKKGLIIREHGICKLGKTLRDERNAYELREIQASKAKHKIAKKAVALIGEDDMIMMDGSSTAHGIIHLLENRPRILIITNNAKICYTCGLSNIQNISLGGEMMRKTFSYVGQETIRAIKNYNVDILFFSCKGVSEKGYLTDTFKEENDVRREMMKRAKKKVALINYDKFGKEYLYNLCHISEVDMVICEEELPEYIKKYLKPGAEL